MTAVEYAVTKNDPELLRILLGAAQKAKGMSFEVYKSSLVEALETIPDFAIDMCFNCDSSIIPFVKAFTPSDTYRIYKTGDKLRVDLTLLGWTGTKSVRANFSVLFKGRSGTLLLVNHNAKTVESVFADMSEEAIEKEVTEMLNKHKRSPKQLHGQKILLAPVLYRGKAITQVIEGYPCSKYEAKYKVSYNRIESNKDLLKIKSFDDYFAESIVSFDFGRNAARPPNDLTEKKYHATVWLCKNYPLKYSQFAPLIYLLSYTSEHIAKFASFVSEHKLEDGFPLKLNVPLFYTVNAIITLKNLRFESMNSDFINVDLQYTSRRGHSETSSFPEVKLYAPISRTRPENFRSFAQAANNSRHLFPSLDAENDRLRWTSYESEENNESLLCAKKRFEDLLREDCDSPHAAPQKDESIIVQIVNNSDEIVNEDAEELNIADCEDEAKGKKAVENVKEHSINKVKTLNSISITLAASNKTDTGQTKRKHEASAKKNQENKKLRLHIKQSPWDSIKTIKKPFYGMALKNSVHREEEKGREELATMKSSYKNVGTRNVMLRKCTEKKFQVYKKTADVDVILIKKL